MRKHFLIPRRAAEKRTIKVHVEGGLVQDVDQRIPAGYEVRVEDRDDGDTSHPSWDAEKGCFVMVYEGGAHGEQTFRCGHARRRRHHQQHRQPGTAPRGR